MVGYESKAKFSIWWKRFLSCFFPVLNTTSSLRKYKAKATLALRTVVGQQSGTEVYPTFFGALQTFVH